MLDPVTEPTGALGIEVGNLQEIRKNKIAVKTHQRICIKQNRCDAGHQENVIGNVGRQTIRIGPNNQRHERNEQFHIHSRRRHDDAMPPAGKSPHRRHVHKRHRRKQQEQHARFRDLATKTLTRNSMSKLVDDF